MLWTTPTGPPRPGRSIESSLLTRGGGRWSSPSLWYCHVADCLHADSFFRYFGTKPSSRDSTMAPSCAPSSTLIIRWFFLFSSCFEFLVEDDGDFEKTHASWPLDDFFIQLMCWMWFLVEDDGDFEKTHASWPLDDFFMKFEKRQFMCLYRMAPGGRDLMAGLIRRFCPSNFQVILFCESFVYQIFSSLGVPACPCGGSPDAPRIMCAWRHSRPTSCDSLDELW